MIKKLIFTILVAVLVFAGYKIKNRPAVVAGDDSDEAPQASWSVQLLSYIIVGFIVLFSSVFFLLNWIDNRTLVTIRVINPQQNATEYTIRKNALKGRRFTTIDNLQVELGADDRLEIIEP